jgi:hypothetical protein
VTLIPVPGGGAGPSIYIGFGAVIGIVIAPAFSGFVNSPYILIIVGGVVGGILGWLGCLFTSDSPPAEIASAAVVMLTVIGLIVGITIPGRITGAIFPLALAAWFVL